MEKITYKETYKDLIKSLRTCGRALESAAFPEWDICLYTRAADAIEELLKVAAVDEKTALAMMAGSNAIRNNRKKYEWTTYMWDVFGKCGGPKEINYFEAANHLASIADPVLHRDAHSFTQSAKHGRLVDADVFKKQLLEEYEKAQQLFQTDLWRERSRELVDAIIQELDEQPTIIPAEGGA